MRQYDRRHANRNDERPAIREPMMTRCKTGTAVTGSMHCSDGLEDSNEPQRADQYLPVREPEDMDG